MKSDRRTFLKSIPALTLAVRGAAPHNARTTVTIEADRFFINGRPTYEGRTYHGMKIEGLLMNSRMVQGIFDDLNPETRPRWRYPDTGKWDPARNTREFVAAMPEWLRHGLLSFTINFQGGSPEGYSNLQPWHNSAFDTDGSIRVDYLKRLELILDRTDVLKMVPIVGIFYFGQDERLRDEAAVKQALRGAIEWLLRKDYRNVLVEVNNECNVRRYEREILRPGRVPELIRLAKSITRHGRRLLVGTSFGGGTVPENEVVAASDFVLMHGNGVEDPERISEMVSQTRRLPGYRPMPILFNEDDHFEFDKPVNNMLKAVGAYASWGYFDPGKNNYTNGYQSPPTRWSINTERKKAFFNLLKEVTGS